MNYFYGKKGIWFHLIGLGCVVWFLVRVVPKPTRCQYPCQQVSLSIAVSYLAFWSLLVSELFLWFRYVKIKIAAVVPVVLASSVVICSVSGGVFAAGLFSQNMTQTTAWKPVPNEPLGVGQGLHPGRVVWVWNPDATKTRLTGYWWNPENNNQSAINTMLSSGIQHLAGKSNDAGAWDSLFRFFNQKHGFGDVGYAPGEKIAIKINLNNCWELYLNPYPRRDNQLDASPYVVAALLHQLVNVVGAAQEDITVFDASRCMANWFYDLVAPLYPNVHYVDAQGGAPGRSKVIPSTVKLFLADETHLTRTLPTVVTEAKYLINMPLLKRHPINQGVTLAGKNFFGCWIEPVADVHPYHTAAFTPGHPTPQTDLFASNQLGGKTLLYIGDGLYATKNDHRTIEKFMMYPFNNDWTNSLFFSQDPVALDSVMFDFLYAEGTNPVEGSQNYLHQSAVPPPNVYDPEGDGVFLNQSLGVHEHWNTTVDIFSTERYVGPDLNGIEFIPVDQNSMQPSVSIIYPQQKYLYFRGIERRSFPFTLVLGHIELRATVLGVNTYHVEKVEFYVNGHHRHTDFDMPYTYLWNIRQCSKCILSVKAYLEGGETLDDTMEIYRIL
ncbi:MAG: DUF362 domain-containing protein [Candidatus Thermoplasmatota archaeon]